MARSRRAWGWHQLDPRWAELVVADARVGTGDLVIDVGAGLGALTRPLIEAGARVIAVEAHPGRAARLRECFGREVVVVTADAGDLRLPRRPFHVVANPPFGISTALLERLVHPGSRLVEAHVVLQLQVARRWARPDGSAARRWRRTFQAELGRPLPRSAFHPRPAVDSRVLVLRRR